MAVEMDIIEHLGGLLDCGDMDSVKSIINEDEFDSVLQERANDLIPIVSCFLLKETLDDRPRVFKYSEKIIMKCAEKGNPKECLMEFLAQIETLDELKLEVLLKPIQIVMIRIPQRKAPLMQCVFNVVHSFINSLPVPEYHHLDNNSKLLIDCDERAIKIREIYELLVPFYEPFVEEASAKCDDKRMKAIRLVVTRALFQLLGNPLVFLDLEDNVKGASKCRSLAFTIVNFIQNLNCDVLNFLTLIEDKQLISEDEEILLIKEFSSNEIKFTDLSLASFFYLTFYENMLNSSIYVYDLHFIFQNCLSLAVTLLRYKDRMVLRKGLLLTKVTIEKVETGTLKFSHLSSNVHKEVLDLLGTIAIYHDVEEDRKLAIDLLRQYFFMFEPKAQFYMLLNISIITCHPNLAGFFTTILTKIMQSVFTNKEVKEYFTGKRLYDLLTLFCSLKNGVETDLIENKEQILSALNLIIYLLKRDKENVTKVWDFAHILNEKFCNPLREAITLSRAHFKLELDKLSDPGTKEDTPDLTVTVGAEDLSNMSMEEKRDVINSGLTVFDLIEHILFRANDSIGDKPDFL